MAIYNGTQKIKMSGIDKVYVGTTLVYQSVQPVTITYLKALYDSTTPATKTVVAGYQLTAEDLPTQTDSTAWSTIGWTLDGTNMVSVGYTVTTNIVLLAVHQGTVTSGNLFKKSKNTAYVGDVASKTISISAISMGNVGNCNSGSTTKTYALAAPAYSRSFSTQSYTKEGYCGVQQGAWGGQVTTISPGKKGRFEWTPARSTVSFTMPSGWTNAANSGNCYPTVVFRRNDTGAHLWHTSQNSKAKISHDIEAPNSGQTNIIYVSYGGNNGSNYGQQLARRTMYREFGSTSGDVTCNTSTTTETFYFYVTP